MTLKDILRDCDCKVEKGIASDSCEATSILLGDQGRTMLFNNLNGGKAVGNLFSTREKVAGFMNIDASQIVSHIMEGMDSPGKVKEVSNPRFSEVVLETDLMKLPIPKYFPEDGGRYITSGIVFAEWNGVRNVSFHRMMIMDKDRIGIRLVPRHLFTLFNQAKESGQELKVTICVGAPIEVLLSAALSMDFGVNELDVAASMYSKGHGRQLECGRSGNGMLIPSETEYVIEGRITFETTSEGPFVDITGTYDVIRDQPVIRIDRITSCKDPVFHVLLPGGYEHLLLMGLPREPMILKTVRQAVPRVRNVRLTEGGCCWLNGVVSIRKNKEGDGVNAIMAAFTGHSSMKQVIIVDDDIDIFNDREVEWAVATRMQGDRILSIPGAAGSSLDPSTHGTTYKVGFDATMPLDADKRMFVKAKVD